MLELTASQNRDGGMNLEKHMNKKTSAFASHQWFEQQMCQEQFCTSVQIHAVLAQMHCIRRGPRGGLLHMVYFGYVLTLGLKGDMNEMYVRIGKTLDEGFERFQSRSYALGK